MILFLPKSVPNAGDQLAPLYLALLRCLFGLTVFRLLSVYRYMILTLKLTKNRSRLDIRKYYFTNRVVEDWNNLTETVITAKNVKIFENRLDKLWQNNPMITNLMKSTLVDGQLLNLSFKLTVF
jgi:hypothetical protein